MCGIFGLINGTKTRNGNMGICRLVGDAIAVNSVRGTDSVGLVQMDKKKIYVERRLGNGFDFISASDIGSYVNDADSAVFTLVHNRAATEGKVSLDNCHPFEHMDETTAGYTVGVHNGTLTGWKNSAHNYDVDSNWAYSRINAAGLDAFKEFNGAYAFVWYDDLTPKVLNFARNFQRPMFVMFTKTGDRMLFASEYMMLAWLADRHNVDLEDRVIELAPGQHYAFNLDNPREFTKTALPYPRSSYTAPASSYDYDKARRERVIAEIVGLFEPAKKTEPTPLTAVTPAPTGPVPSVGTTTTRSTGLLVTPAEARMAKAAELYHKPVTFAAEHYDNTTCELWGTVTIESILYTAVIRRVNQATYDTWKNATTLGCQVVGASSDGDIAGTKDLSLILSRNVTMNTEVVDTDALEANLAQSIAAHFADRERGSDAVVFGA